MVESTRIRWKWLILGIWRDLKVLKYIHDGPTRVTTLGTVSFYSSFLAQIVHLMWDWIENG